MRRGRILDAISLHSSNGASAIIHVGYTLGSSTDCILTHHIHRDTTKARLKVFLPNNVLT